MPTRRIEQAERLETEDEKKTEEQRLLSLRKEIELEVVKKYDTLNDDDFLFLMDTKWLNKWANFVETEEGIEPGPISTYELLDDEFKPITFLQPKIDYRGICPMVYYMLREFHGKDESPEFVKYTCDIFSINVLEKDLIKAQMDIQQKATANAKRLRAKWIPPPPPDDEEDQRIDCCGCCYLTKEHIEAFLYWLVLCCARRSDGRKDISYRQYMPLKAKKKRNKMRRNRSGSVGTNRSEFEFRFGDLDDDGESVLDDAVSVSNAELGHQAGGHWLRNYIANKESILK